MESQKDLKKLNKVEFVCEGGVELLWKDGRKRIPIDYCKPLIYHNLNLGKRRE